LSAKLLKKHTEKFLLSCFTSSKKLLIIHITRTTTLGLLYLVYLCSYDFRSFLWGKLGRKQRQALSPLLFFCKSIRQIYFLQKLILHPTHIECQDFCGQNYDFSKIFSIFPDFLASLAQFTAIQQQIRNQLEIFVNICENQKLKTKNLKLKIVE